MHDSPKSGGHGRVRGRRPGGDADGRLGADEHVARRGQRSSN